MSNIEYRTTPFKHQKELVESTWDRPAHAILWEQGTGKTKALIDIATKLYLEGKIDAILVVAPSGVDRNWISDEIPVHMLEKVLAKTRMGTYKTKKINTKWHQRELNAILKHDGLAILTISYDAFITPKGKKFVWRFLKNRKVLYVLDEAHAIKTPGAKRTKSIVASGKYAPYRRILTGTPVSQGPFDIYSQIRFVDPSFWANRGIRTFSEFKTEYGIWAQGYNRSQDRYYDVLQSYRNLDQLADYLSEMSSRVVKDDVLDLPPKMYSKRYFEMTKDQKDLYDAIVSQIVDWDANIDDESENLAIVRLLRLQQVVCGYYIDEDKNLIDIDDVNPRIDLLEDITANLGHQAIIWSKFTRSVNLIMDRLGSAAVRYDGQVSEEDCEKAKERFQKGDVQFFVANPAKGKEGLTLHMAKTVIYESNSFKLIDRLQSEDRAHRAGMDDNPVHYIDLACPETVDMHIIDSLRSKVDIATALTRDKLKEWI